MTSDASPTAYTEHLRPPFWYWLVGLGFASSLGIAGVVGGTALAVGLLAVSGAVVVGGLAAASTTVTVRDGELRAGGAHVPVALLGEPEALEGEDARTRRGRSSDPTAFHVLRPWVGGGVVVPLLDPRDPHPYWYVASRRPRRLAAALRAARLDVATAR